MFKNLSTDKSGIILVTVLIIIMVMTVLAISSLFVNISEVEKIEALADDLRARELAQMYYWRLYDNGIVAPANFVELIAGKQFNIIITALPGVPGEPVLYEINVLY